MEWHVTLDLLAELQLRRLGEITASACTKSIGSRWRHALLLLAHTELKCLQLGIVSFTSFIQACRQQWEECAGLLNQVGQEGLEKDIILLSAASSAIGSSKWQAAVACVRAAGTLRLQADAQSCSLGISTCAAVFQWREALALQQDLRRGLQADAVAFNATICSCQNTGRWQQALCLLVVMEKMGPCPVVISFSSTMGACVQATKEWGRALVLLQMLANHGMQPTQIVYNTLAGALGWHGAWQLLADLRKRRSFDVITTNATISACAKAVAWRQAFFIVQYMGEAHLKRDATTLNTSQTVCRKALLWQRSLAIETWRQALSAASGTWAAAAAALTHADEKGDEAALGTTIGFCAKCSEWSRALELLRGAAILAVLVNEIMLNAGIHACQRATSPGHQWPAAMNLFSTMAACRVSWDDATCVSLIASEDVGRWMRSLSCLSLFEMHGRHGSITALNAAVGALAACGGWCRAVSLLQATAGKLRANEVTFNSLISCQRRAGWQLAFFVLKSLPQRSLLASLPAYSATISACERAGDWQGAVLMLRELEASRIRTDSIAFNAVISTCEKASEWQRGLSILDQMTSRSVEASVVTYNAAMSACGKAEKSEVVLELLRHLESSSMLLDVVSYNVAISAFGLAGRWRRALQMLEALSQPSAASFGAAVSACATAAKWKQSLLLFTEAKSRSLSTVITLSAAVSACSRAQQWKWSLSLFEAAERFNTSPDIVTCIATIAACAACSRYATVRVLAKLTSRTQEELVARKPGVWAATEQENRAALVQAKHVMH